jgi:rhodanese-related sulfurtransferase
VRTAEEYAEAHIPGAVMLDFYSRTFRQDLDTLFKEAPIALYCRSGNRSGQALEIMRELGFTDVRNLDGGIITWAENGGSLESG